MRKCPYCDFNSHALRAATIEERLYIDALLGDLDAELPALDGRTVLTVFIGGGTPSLLSVSTVERLLNALRSRLKLPASTEITLEANPGVSDHGKFVEFRAAGINRLSLGVQSFDDDMLRALGRIHDGDAATAAVEAAHRAGFAEINIDLMFALPRQTPAQALADVDRAISLQPSHLSHYQLTLEPNTAFYRSPPPLPDDDIAWHMQLRSRRRLARAGYSRYEVSAYGLPGSFCRHNLNYWQFGDYLGIGAGAHGKLTRAGDGLKIVRHQKHRHPRRYLAALSGEHAAGRYDVVSTELPFEFMLNALRLTRGVPTALFGERTGLSLETIEAPLRMARQRGLLSADPQNLRPTARGRRFLNDLIMQFLTDR